MPQVWCTATTYHPSSSVSWWVSSQGCARTRRNSDGTGLKDLTKEPQVNGDGPADTIPQVSPNGKLVAFNRCFPDAPCLVATVNMNGSHLRQLTDNSLFATYRPNWSPDSKKIVFTMQANGTADIASMNADGSGLTQLTFNQAVHDSLRVDIRLAPLTHGSCSDSFVSWYE